jgi:hypothetical protein
MAAAAAARDTRKRGITGWNGRGVEEKPDPVEEMGEETGGRRSGRRQLTHRRQLAMIASWPSP